MNGLRLGRRSVHVVSVSSKLILSGAGECSSAIRRDTCKSVWKGEIMRLDELLVSRHIAFQRLPHRRTYAANRVAQALHVKGREVAKTVLVRTGHGHVLAVLPATHHIDLEQLGTDLGGEHVELASEDEMGKLFPDCECGAVPPFGS